MTREAREEMGSDAAFGQEIAWRERLIQFVIPRLVGDDSDKEQALQMITASVDAAHSKGLRDAASMAVRWSESVGTSTHTGKALKIAADAYNKLADMNDAGVYSA